MEDWPQKVKQTEFTKLLGIQYPLICGAMYPCTNPELVASVSRAGGIGIIQPLSFMYVHKVGLRQGIQQIKALTDKPFGFNVLTEQSSKTYQKKMQEWMDIALEEGCKFFISALGNPKWIVEKAKQVNGVVFHDVTEKKWAQKALDSGVDGLICVNQRAGGHAGQKSPQDLYNELKDFNVPLICAGGIGSEKSFNQALSMGYSGVQMGTRFIASNECHAHMDYKQAIVKAKEEDIVLTEKLTGVPVAIINTPTVQKVGTKASGLAKYMLKHPKFKHWIRLFYSLKSFYFLKHASLKGFSYQDFWQAGKSVDEIHEIESASDIVERFGKSWLNA